MGLKESKNSHEDHLDEPYPIGSSIRLDVSSAIKAVESAGSGSAGLNQLELLMQLAGANPTRREVQDLLVHLKQASILAITPTVLYSVLDRFYDAADHAPGGSGATLDDAWRVIDRDHDGKVAGAEIDHLTTMLTTLGEPLTQEEMEDLLSTMDVDQDGEISRFEFFLTLA